MLLLLNSGDWRDRARRFKNQLVRNYHSLRIYSVAGSYSILFRPTPYRVLLVLSHMRSGSSLLTHLLSSHPDIIGYGETHLNYTSEPDFKTLVAKVYGQRLKVSMNHPYVLDKLLHNNKLLTPDLLKSDQVRIIFLLREPNSALTSLLKLKSHWTEEQAVTYYSDRLETLAHYAEWVNDPGRCMFFTYDQLVNQTSSVFALLETSLEVHQPFSEQYQVLQTTGQKGVGDSSSTIKAGRILRRSPSQSDRALQPDTLARAQNCFTQCHQVLERYSHTINSTQ